MKPDKQNHTPQYQIMKCCVGWNRDKSGLFILKYFGADIPSMRVYKYKSRECFVCTLSNRNCPTKSNPTTIWWVLTFHKSHETLANQLQTMCRFTTKLLDERYSLSCGTKSCLEKHYRTRTLPLSLGHEHITP